MVTGVYPSSPWYVPFLLFVAHSVQHSHRSSVFIECSYIQLTLSRVPLIKCFTQEKAPTSMPSVRLEPTKSVLIGTRITYRATGDADFYEGVRPYALHGASIK